MHIYITYLGNYYRIGGVRQLFCHENGSYYNEFIKHNIDITHKSIHSFNKLLLKPLKQDCHTDSITLQMLSKTMSWVFAT